MKAADWRFPAAAQDAGERTKMSELISFENTTFAYPESSENLAQLVFENLNLEIEEGSFVAVLGHNGSGKSTLAKHMNSVLLPSGGKVWIAGYDSSNEDDIINIRRSVGMVFQNPDNQIVSNVVEEDVAFAPENLGIPSDEIRHRVDEALKLVGMYDYREHAPHLLSGGQKQRIAIAGVIAMRPRCVVLDEPTAMLDPKGRKDVIETIIRLNRESGITVVLITHHMSEAALADRLIVMADGKILVDDVPRNVFCNVELLADAGLTVPDTTALIYELNGLGAELPLDAISVTECAEVLYDFITKEN